MEKVKEMAAKAKVAVSSDKSHGNTTHTGPTHTGTTHTGAAHTGTTHTGTTHTGPHSSGVANAADPRVDSDRDASRNMGAASHGPGGHTTTTGIGGAGTGHTTTTTSQNTAGPHSSDLLNKLDPRVDSDRDGSKNMGAAQHGPGGHTTTTGLGTAGHGPTGHSTTTGLGSTGHTTAGSTNYGPHDSNLLNKADPRVDSDRDGSRNVGAASHGPGGHTTTGGLGTTGHTTTGGLGTTGHTTAGSTNYGPHDSNLLNKADPRVDSDRDGSRNYGAASHGPGGHTHTTTTGLGTAGHSTNTSTNHGPHSSNLMNKADPRVDSDRDGSRNVGAAQHGPGGHTTTTTSGSTNAGPHSSNLLNKLDPRVDSDLDGSRNAGAAGRTV